MLDINSMDFCKSSFASLKKMRDAQIFVDLEIVFSSGLKIPVHKCVLAAGSRYFNGFISANFYHGVCSSFFLHFSYLQQRIIEMKDQNSALKVNGVLFCDKLMSLVNAYLPLFIM